MIGRVIIAVVFILIINVLVFGYFRYSKNKLNSDYRRELIQMQGKWDGQDKQRERKQNQEIDKRYGDTDIDRILNNPNLPIAEAIKKLANIYAPEYSKTSVSVDNFTEFSLVVNVVELPDTKVQALFLKNLFSHIKREYVFEVIFMDFDGDQVLIEQPKLLKVKNFRTSSLNTITKACLK